MLSAAASSFPRCYNLLECAFKQKKTKHSYTFIEQKPKTLVLTSKFLEVDVPIVWAKNQIRKIDVIPSNDYTKNFVASIQSTSGYPKNEMAEIPKQIS
jgi:hypothetical protein